MSTTVRDGLVILQTPTTTTTNSTTIHAGQIRSCINTRECVISVINMDDSGPKCSHDELDLVLEDEQ